MNASAINNNSSDAVRVRVEELMHKDVTPQKVAELYSRWAEGDVYDIELKSNLYNGPQVLAKAAAGGLSEQYISQARVLDVAAGTGLCVETMRTKGFRHFDALDPSEGMLEKAKAKHLYENYFCTFISDQELEIPEDTYDVLISCGGFGNGHIPCGAIKEMIRLVKPGGFIVIVTRHEHLLKVEMYKDKLEPLMKDLEGQGKWTRLERRVFPNYFNGFDGLLLKYQVC